MLGALKRVLGIFSIPFASLETGCMLKVSGTTHPTTGNRPAIFLNSHAWQERGETSKFLLNLTQGKPEHSDTA